jgi:hypothetical protein
LHNDVFDSSFEISFAFSFRKESNDVKSEQQPPTSTSIVDDVKPTVELSSSSQLQQHPESTPTVTTTVTTTELSSATNDANADTGMFVRLLISIFSSQAQFGV